MATAAASSTPAAASSDYGVSGFDRDLLSAAELKKNAKTLPREVMIEALSRGLVAVRVNALNMLKAHGKLTDVELMTVAVMLRDESPSVRAAAAGAMAEAQDPTTVVAALCTASIDNETTVREAAASAIQSFGAAALPHLVGALAYDPQQADEEVIPHIAAIGDKAAGPLTDAMQHDDERVRGNAVGALMALGPATLSAHQESLVPLGADSSPAVAEMARAAMNAIYRHTRPSHLTPADAPAPHFGDQRLSDAEVKKCSKADTTVLLHYARDGRKLARLNAWRCVELAGTIDDYTTALALVALKDHEAEVRAQACRVVTMCADDRLDDVVRGLVRGAMDSDVRVRDAAWEAFDTLEKRSLPTLVGQLGERDQDRAQIVVKALSRHSAKAAKPLYETLKHIGPIERWNALLTLMAIGGKTLEGAHGQLCTMLIEPFDIARAMVVRALGKLPKQSKADADVVEALEHMLEYDASLAVRVEADVALRFIHGARG